MKKTEIKITARGVFSFSIRETRLWPASRLAYLKKRLTIVSSLRAGIRSATFTCSVRETHSLQ